MLLITTQPQDAQIFRFLKKWLTKNYDRGHFENQQTERHILNCKKLQNFAQSSTDCHKNCYTIGAQIISTSDLSH